MFARVVNIDPASQVDSVDRDLTKDALDESEKEKLREVAVENILSVYG